MSIDKFLRLNNIKITKGRIKIIEVLKDCSVGVTAEYIHDQCKNNGCNVDLSTVYRNLELLNNKGIVDKFDIGDGKYNYVINHNKHTHPLECTICHKEVEIDCPIQQLEQIIKNKTGFTLAEQEVNIKFKGVCKDCLIKE
ncbi:transcriptional repressor [Clostridium sp. MSJ-11]|uniref:Transcriptional repressor n=1 Tax=Clostridium mobile TaxID=2841512 RepID=A0ABS6EKG7_9CLOT|nr:Fur family transcriptional regulator [Clostridium mobile]MBU5485708.1 transcriptional repressor [Clostridium mobile]